MGQLIVVSLTPIPPRRNELVKLGLVRFAGNWTVFNDGYGVYIQTADQNNYVEIVFYGTGLNLLYVANGSYDTRATIDGGSEGGYTGSIGVREDPVRPFSYQDEFSVVS